ncbi:MAG: hypothetical protein K1X79_02460 [Oligoflexia bacterium]|nr:hypothetical protein [Oligoflexia bacterium]
MFKELYVQSLRAQAVQVRSVAAEDLQWAEAVIASASLTRTCPDNVWQQLSASQRAARFIQGWSNAVAAGRFDEALKETDFLRAAFPQVWASEDAANLTVDLSRLTKYPTVNTTWGAVLKAIEAARQERRPITIAVSQCLEKNTDVIAGFDAWRLNKLAPGETVRVDNFSDRTKIKGWSALRDIQQKLNYPVQIVFILGDMDYLTVFQCQRWCDPNSLSGFGEEMAKRRANLQEEADAFFGAGRAAVRLWSELYSFNSFESERARAADQATWRDYNGIIEPTIRMYREQWGFNALGQREKLTQDQLRSLIINEILNVAAQYRLESRLLVSEGAIQGWAEQVPSPSWPISISNYDGALEVPSLLLV